MGLLLFCFAAAAYAQDSPERTEKKKLIAMIENELAGAWTIGSPEDNPCFGTLDRLYPEWHGGDPAAARRKWTFHGYETYHVFYRVYTLDMSQPGLAVLKGKKTVLQQRMITFSIFPPELKRETFSWNFSVICRCLPSGEWKIIKETVE